MRKYIKHRWRILAYCWLAAATSFSIGYTWERSKDANSDLRDAVQQAFEDNCNTGNKLRADIRKVLRAFEVDSDKIQPFTAKNCAEVRFIPRR